MSDFDINNAIEKYEEIARYYREGYMDEEQTKYSIAELNEECKNNDVVFKATFESLELHIKSEEEESFDESDSYSYEDYDDDDSY